MNKKNFLMSLKLTVIMVYKIIYKKYSKLILVREDAKFSANQNFNNDTTLKADETNINNFDDFSFHCPHLLSMDFKSLGLFSFLYFYYF
jgi:hypothetical protein